MPPRNDELPEGTDHIINGAMETNPGGGGGIGDDDLGLGGGLGATTTGGGGASSGFIGSGAGDGTGGTSAGSGGTTGGLELAGSDIATGGLASGGSGTSATGGTMVDQLKTEAASLKGEAGTKVREFAEGGKARASDALQELSRVVSEAADSIEERLGAEYGGYARRASGAVSDFADNLRNKEVDELYDGARAVVRRSPGVAIATAAVVGFALVRLIKAGMPDRSDGDSSGGSSRGTGGTGA